MTELRRALEGHRPALKKAFLFSLVAGLLVLAPVAYMFEVYGRVIDSRSFSTLFWLTVLVVGSYMVLEFSDWARLELMRAEALRFEQVMATRVFDVMFQVNRESGQIGQTQAIQDLRVLKEFFYSPALMAALESPTLLVFLVILFLAHPLLGVVALAAAVVQVVVGSFADRRTRPPIVQANTLASEAQRYADSSLRNASVLEAMGMLHGVLGRWSALQKQVLQLQAFASSNAATAQGLAKFLQLGVSSGLLGLGAWLLLTNQLVGGAAMMIVASTLGARILAPLAQIMGHWRSVVNAREAFFRMEALLEQHSAEAERMPLPAPTGNVAVENLTVMPPGRSIPTVRGLNFKLSAGEVLVVMGPSGSGKTSLARALTGLWPASSGKVRLDGADVFMWNKAELGRHIGYLPQGIELFDGTIAENIARFSSIDELAVQAAVDLSGLSQLLAGLPKGVNTLIGSEGEQISRGQLQRIALARAIYGSPSFVVLDEPNSNLDSLGDTSLLNVVKAKKLEGVTFVLVTHRMDILKAADKVLLLKDGSQAAFGPRDDVLEALRQANQKLNQLRSSGHVAP